MVNEKRRNTTKKSKLTVSIRRSAGEMRNSPAAYYGGLGQMGYNPINVRKIAEESQAMKAVKATFEDGRQLTFAEAPPERGPVEVLVVFPEAGEDPWQGILAEQTPRPAFAEFAKQCLEKIAKGKAKPLEVDQL
jgi:hypothetical protein